jgi:hypothetical protein
LRAIVAIITLLWTCAINVRSYFFYLFNCAMPCFRLLSAMFLSLSFHTKFIILVIVGFPLYIFAFACLFICCVLFIVYVFLCNYCIFYCPKCAKRVLLYLEAIKVLKS